MSIEQTVEIPVSQNNSLFWTGNLIVQNGRGAGVLVASLRRIMSVNSWLECQMSAGNRNAMSLTGFRRLTKHSHIRMSGSCQIEPHHIAFAEFNTMLASQFDRNLTGQLEFKMQGGRSSMCSALRWDNQTHHLECALQVGVPNCFVKLAYVRRFVEKEAKTTIAGKLGTMGFVVEYGMEKKISQYSILGGYVSIGVPVGVLVKIKLQRGNQTYVCPVHLAEEIIPEAIFYGTAVPIAAYFIIRNLIIRPFLDQKKEEEVNKKKEKFAEEIAERRREAQAAKELMQATVRRSREEEELKGGLIIVKAWYGKLATTHTGELNESQCIEVKDPLQALVRLSKLVLPDSKTKSNIPGFYDPCIGEDKSLYIRYKFQRVLHETTVGDLEPIKIPKQKHLIRSGSDENS